MGNLPVYTFFAQDARGLFDDTDLDAGGEVVTDTDTFSDGETVLDEGEPLHTDVDVEFLDRTSRCTHLEAEAVIGVIRDCIGENRFTVFSSLRNGVVTVQWKDKPVTSIY